MSQVTHHNDDLAGACNFSGRNFYRCNRAIKRRNQCGLRKLRLRLDDSIPLMGVGGILSGGDAAGKIVAGARLVQFYTGMIYRGPELIGECVSSIRRLREGVA